MDEQQKVNYNRMRKVMPVYFVGLGAAFFLTFFVFLFFALEKKEKEKRSCFMFISTQNVYLLKISDQYK